MNNQKQIAVFGGGCFWCLEAVFTRLKGVSGVSSGYAGGFAEDPNYEQVSKNETGHAEVVKVEFNPDEISYSDLLQIFFASHDPTTINCQGNDVGPQYRSIILYSDDSQRKAAEEIIGELQKEKVFDGSVATEVKELDKFYPAENYHDKYYDKNPSLPYCQIIISPKIGKLKEKFARLLREEM
jgi:peptide-methionine (S)-S-oxide reductase